MNKRITAAIFTHPQTLASRSMPLYAALISNGLRDRGHEVRMMSSPIYLGGLIPKQFWNKWIGYIDQYIIYPWLARREIRDLPPDTIFIFADQALGPWVPLAAHRPHVVHCHDLLALKSALGHFPENPTKLSGQAYQRFIRRGFRRAKHFISISAKTERDLLEFGGIHAKTKVVIPNCLNYPYKPQSREAAIAALKAQHLPATEQGMLLNVAGNQWYKNRRGLIQIYAQYAARVANPLPLWCVGPQPDVELRGEIEKLNGIGRVFFFQGLTAESLEAAYSLASAMIFPSLEEGFGWPIIEAQACRCPVLTTDAAPMNEVAGPAAILLPRLGSGRMGSQQWSQECASRLIELLERTSSHRAAIATAGELWAAKFNTESTISAFIDVYSKVLRIHSGRPGVKGAVHE